MIDVQKEKLLTLSRAASLDWLPERRFGKRLAPSTLFRWASTGRKGVRLEVVRVSGTLCTSEAALLRFFQRLDSLPCQPTLESRTDASDGRFLDAEGIGAPKPPSSRR